MTFLKALKKLIKRKAESDMVYEVLPDLYEDWKELMFMNELLVNFVKELKEQMAKGE